MQGLYQDIVSYEYMIESAKVKGKELVLQSPRSQVGSISSQISLDYLSLKDQAKVCNL